MGEINAGDVIARLRFDATQFDAALASAVQRLGALTQTFSTLRQQQSTTQQTTTGLATAVTGLTQALTQHTSASTAAQQAALAYRRSQDEAREAVRRHREETVQATQASRGWQAMLSVAGGIGIATSVGAAVSAMKQFAVSVIEVGARFQQLRAGISAVVGGTQQGAQAFQFLTDTANRLGIRVLGLTDNFRAFAAATRGTSLEGEQTRRIFEAVATAGRVLGSSNQQLERGFLALSQMMSKSVVSMEEVRQQLAEAIPGAMQIAARAMGVTTERLNEMIASGEVLSVDFLPKFAAQLRQELGQGATDAANTAQGAFARLENEWLALKERIARSGPLRFVTTVVSSIAAGLQGGREEDEAIQAAIERTTRQTRVPVAPRVTRPGTLEGATEADLGTLRQFVQERKRLEEELAAITKRQTGLPGWLGWTQGKLRADTEAAIDAINKKLQDQIALITQRRFAQQGVAAVTPGQGITEDRLTRDAEQAKATEEANKRLSASMGDLKKQLADIDALNRLVPERLGDSADKADQKIAMLNASLKDQFEALKKIAVQAKALGTAIAPENQKQLDDIRANIRATEEEIEGIKKSEAAKKKALQATEQERKRIAAEAIRDEEQSITKMIELQGLLARARQFAARPEESPAAEARTRVETQGAAMQVSLEKAIEGMMESPAQLRRGPEVLAQLREALEGLPAAVAGQGQQAFDAVLKTKFVDPLEKLARQYGMTKQEGDALLAQQQAFALIGSPWEEQAFDILDLVKGVGKLEESLGRLRGQAAASAHAFEQSRPFTGGMEQRLEQLKTPMSFGLPGDTERILRFQARQRRIPLEEAQEALLKQITAQERLNQVLSITERIGDSAAQTLTNGLMAIVNGTQSVAAGFKAMGKAILDTIAQITMQEGFRMLISLGLSALGGALSGAGAGAVNPAANPAAHNIQALQIPKSYATGGMVNTPTLAWLGENRAMNPEYVLNRPQMEAMMRAGPSAGGQAVNVTTILVDSRQQADLAAARERGLGRQVIIQEVANDLAKGNGSMLGTLMRAQMG